MNFDNPAHRLLSLIERGKSIDPNIGVWDAWGILLKVSPKEDMPELLTRLAIVMRLPNETVETFKAYYPNHRDVWSYWQNQINAAFKAQELHGSWHSFIKKIDPHSVSHLVTATTLLDLKMGTSALSDEKIKEIRDELVSIRKEVVDSDIDGALKKYLSEEIGRLIDSIMEYQIAGSYPILLEIEAAFGHIATDEPYREFLKDMDAGKRFKESLKTMADAVSVSLGMPQILQALLAFLPK